MPQLAGAVYRHMVHMPQLAGAGNPAHGRYATADQCCNPAHGPYATAGRCYNPAHGPYATAGRCYGPAHGFITILSALPRHTRVTMCMTSVAVVGCTPTTWLSSSVVDLSNKCNVVVTCARHASNMFKPHSSIAQVGFRHAFVPCFLIS